MDWRKHISVDPNVCHGKACVKGTRALVSVILENLAVGLTPEQVVETYPSLTVNDIRAALSFAAELAGERVISFPHAQAS